MLNTLLAHNDYGSVAPLGENQVFEAERALLQQRGHTVSEFTRHSDEIRRQGAWGAIQGAFAVPWNPGRSSPFAGPWTPFNPPWCMSITPSR